VPLGSVLGPLFFILYINFIFHTIKNCEIICYADDTSLTLYSASSEPLLANAKVSINQVFNWLSSNLYSLNIKKSKIIRYSWCKSDACFDKIFIHSYTCSNRVDCACDYLEYVDRYKYLGVIIDSKLSSSCHVNYICKKL